MVIHRFNFFDQIAVFIAILVLALLSMSLGFTIGNNAPKYCPAATVMDYQSQGLMR